MSREIMQCQGCLFKLLWGRGCKLSVTKLSKFHCKVMSVVNIIFTTKVKLIFFVILNQHFQNIWRFANNGRSSSIAERLQVLLGKTEMLKWMNNLCTKNDVFN